MGRWNEYYERGYNERFISFGANRAAYRYALENLGMRYEEEVLPEGQATFVLGGVHPKADSAAEFLGYCKEVHPNQPDDRYVIMDQNEQALRELKVTEGVRLHGSLEQLSRYFPQESVDMLILDLTLNFMNDQQVRQFAQEAGTVMKPNGLVMAAVSDVMFPRLASITGSWKNHGVPYYARRITDTLGLTEPYLKPVEIGHFESQMGIVKPSHTMVVYTPPGSRYQPVRDESAFYDIRYREFLRRSVQEE